ALTGRERQLDVVTRDHEAARVRRSDDDIGLGERRRDLVERERLSLESSRDASPPLFAAIRDEGNSRPPRDQPAGRRLADPAGADQQPLPVAQIAEDALGQHGGRGSSGRGRIAYRSLRSHLAADAQRLAEGTVEQRPRRSERVGGANLPQDLRLATNARVEPGGDAEEVPGGLVVRAPVKGAID